MRPALICLLAVTVTACSAGPRSSAGRTAEVPDTATARLGPDEVEVYTNSATATLALLDAVRRAQRSIDAEIYEFGRPDLVLAMVSAVQRGVRVRVVGDPSVAVTLATGRRLAAAGATFTSFPVGPRQIDHVKLLLIDAEQAYFGGVNWGAHSYLNHDYEVRVAGPAVSRLEALFAADLGRSGRAAAVAMATPATPSEPMVLTSYPVDEIGPAVVAAVRAARVSIRVEMFVMTDASAIAALQNAARRGLQVQVLFDPGQDLNQAAMVKLRTAGVRCRFYPTHGELLHAKVAVMDGERLVMGSANWTASGFRHNHELDTVLVQRSLAAAVTARMDADWALAGATEGVS